MSDIPGIVLNSTTTTTTATTATTANTSNNVTVTLSNPGGFRPEDHPDYVRALDDHDFCDETVVCRHCGSTLGGGDIRRAVSFTGTGYDQGGHYVNSSTGAVEWDHDYIENDGYDDVKTDYFMCDNCGAEEADLDDLVVAYPNPTEAEQDSLGYSDDSAFVRSVKEKRMITFDSSAWEQENEEQIKAERARQLAHDRQMLEQLQRRIAAAENAD